MKVKIVAIFYRKFLSVSIAWYWRSTWDFVKLIRGYSQSTFRNEEGSCQIKTKVSVWIVIPTKQQAEITIHAKLHHEKAFTRAEDPQYARLNEKKLQWIVFGGFILHISMYQNYPSFAT